MQVRHERVGLVRGTICGLSVLVLRRVDTLGWVASPYISAEDSV